VKKKLSIVDIAKHLNISKSSVSFILNGRAQEKRISEELVERVTKYVEEVGYKPNSFAKSLRTGKSNTIGLMVEDISNPFFAKIARLIEDRTYQNGYKMIYCSTDNNTQKTLELITMFRDRHVDGYIIAPPEGIEDEINSLLKEDLPVVFFDRYLPAIDTDHVVIDNRLSTYNATIHLIEQGFKNIGFVTFSSVQLQLQNRLQGYRDALKEHNLKASIKEIVFNQNESVMYDPIHSFLKKQKNLDAVLFSTNHLGVLGLKIINELGIKVPSELAVASFDDYEVFQLYSPPITAIAQPIEAIADNIITILLNKLSSTSKQKTSQSVTLSTQLMIRKSSSKDL
jgi:Transcriptional regulators